MGDAQRTFKALKQTDKTLDMAFLSNKIFRSKYSYSVYSGPDWHVALPRILTRKEAVVCLGCLSYEITVAEDSGLIIKKYSCWPILTAHGIEYFITHDTYFTALEPRLIVNFEDYFDEAFP